MTESETTTLTTTRDLFRKHHLRCTKQRMALYDALRMCKSHPSAEDLFRMVKPNGGHLSRATVYNTLEALCSAGLARRITNCNGSYRYDADVSDHIHFREIGGTQIRDVPPVLGKKLFEKLPKSVLAEIESSMGVKVSEIHIELTGQVQ